MHCSFEKQPTLPIVPATVDVRPVAPDARRRPAGPARRDRRERRGRESDQDRKRRRRREEREEDYHLKSGKGRLRREETNQSLIQGGSGNSRRRWRRRPTIFCIGYVATDAMATGCSRRCRRRRPASLPMKDMRLARYHSLAAAAGCRTSNQGHHPPLVGRSDGLGTKSRKENDQATFEFPPSA